MQVFDPSSEHYQQLRKHIVHDVVYFAEDKNRLQDQLDNRVCEFSYKDLVGSNINKDGKSPKKRS